MEHPELETLRADALRALAAAADAAALDAWRVAYMGRRGRVTAVLRGVRDLPETERPQAGQAGEPTQDGVGGSTGCAPRRDYGFCGRR